MFGKANQGRRTASSYAQPSSFDPGWKAWVSVVKVPRLQIVIDLENCRFKLVFKKELSVFVYGQFVAGVIGKYKKYDFVVKSCDEVY